MTDLTQLTDDQVRALLNAGSQVQPTDATTGAPLPAAQADAYRHMNQTGQLDLKAQPGSAHLPLAQRADGATPAQGQYYVAPDGAVVQQGGYDPRALQGVSEADIRAALANSAPNMSVPEDVGRSLVTGLEKGVAAIPGTIGDLQNMWGQGVEGAAKWGGRKLGLFTPQQIALQDAAGPTDFAAYNGVATSAPFQQAMQRLMGPYHQPQTPAGRFAQTIGEFAPAALGGEGGAAARLGRIVLPATGSEAAGELAQGTPYEGAARFGGAVLGGGVMGAGERIAQAPQMAAARYLEGYTPEQIADALGFQAEQLDRHGIQLTPLEALTQRSGGAANQLQHYVENSYAGRPLTQPFFDQRLGQVRDAVQQLADQISEPHPMGPAMLGAEAQRGAHFAMDQVRRDINQQARPYYDALIHQEMSPLEYQQLEQNASYRHALDDFRQNHEVSSRYQELPDNNLAVVNEVEKQLDANAQAGRRGDPNPTGNHQLEAARMEARALADELARITSETWYGGEYGGARDIEAQLRRERLEPLDAGPLGTINKTSHLTTQLNALFPNQPNVGGAADMVGALMHLPGDVRGPLVRQHVLDTADNALRDLQPGENQWGGARLAKALASSDEQAARLDAGVRTVAGADQAELMASLLEGLRATGKRLQPGSQTQFNAERAAALGVSPTPIRTAARILDPLEWGKHIDQAVGGAMYRNNVGSLADLITRMQGPEAEAFLNRAALASQPRPEMLRQALIYALEAHQH